LKSHAKTTWSKSTHYARMRAIDPSLSGMSFEGLILGLLHKSSSIVVQLCTSHAPLNHHLHCIGKSNTLTCPNYGSERKTIFHFFFTCPADCCP
ncbi:hypothetical protein OBBRIDRAFT_730656, partial [Obba rivulosa]